MAIQGHIGLFCSQRKQEGGLKMLASFLKVPKTWRLKALKIHVFDYNTVIDAYVHGTSALQMDRQIETPRFALRASRGKN